MKKKWSLNAHKANCAYVHLSDGLPRNPTTNKIKLEILEISSIDCRTV